MPHPVDKHVGHRIRQRRWLLGLSQNQLAEQVGIKFQQIQKYETGANRVSASRLWDISKILEVPVSHFFDGLDSDTPAPATDPMAEKETLELVRVYYQLPEALRRRLLELAKTLAETPDQRAA